MFVDRNQNFESIPQTPKTSHITADSCRNNALPTKMPSQQPLEGGPSPAASKSESDLEHRLAEYDHRLGPQLLAPDADPDPEPRRLPPPTTIFGTEMQEYEPPKRDSRFVQAWRWLKSHPYLAAAALTGFVGLVSLIVLPIVLRDLDQQTPDGTTSPSNSTILPSTSSTIPPPGSTTSPTPTSSPTGLPTECLSTALFVPGVSFMGIRDGSDWQWTSLSPGSQTPESCCAACFAVPGPRRCNSWSWNPVGNRFTPCTANYGWDKGARPDGECPGGYAQVFFETGGDRDKAFGGAGPCGVVS